MRWTINVKDDKSKRIIIKYDPLSDLVIFAGQCNIHNKGWVDFSSNFISSKEIDLQKILNMLVISHNEITERFETYENLNKGLNSVREVDFEIVL